MQRLPGVDAGFLYMETPSLHMHTLKIAVLDVSGAEGGYSLDRLRHELAERLPLLPPFRRRIVPVPGGLHHPVWVQDAELDMTEHVQRVALPPAATWSDVQDAIGAFASVQLDRRRPLWRIQVLEGLEDGRVVVVAKVHHCLADGVASAALLTNVMTPDGAPPDAALAGGDGAEQPSRAPRGPRLVAQGLVDLVRQLGSLPGLLVSTLPRVFAVLRERMRSPVRTPRPLVDVPKTTFNTALTPRRSFATTRLGLDDVRAVAKAFDVTVTDVILAVTGAALRDWLADAGTLPRKSLVASVPVSTDADVRLVGNRVSSLITTLATDVADPVERLHRVHEGSVAAKRVQETLGHDMLESWVQFTPPWLFAAFMRLYSRLRIARLHPPPINVVVSSVPGPRQPLHLLGARLVDLYSVGPILEGIGLNVTAWSYVDHVNVSAIACPDTLPDLRGITDRMPARLAELVARVPRTGDATVA